MKGSIIDFVNFRLSIFRWPSIFDIVLTDLRLFVDFERSVLRLLRAFGPPVFHLFETFSVSFISDLQRFVDFGIFGVTFTSDFWCFIYFRNSVLRLFRAFVYFGHSVFPWRRSFGDAFILDLRFCVDFECCVYFGLSGFRLLRTYFALLTSDFH